MVSLGKFKENILFVTFSKKPKLKIIVERPKMNQTPYASGVGSIMYGMVCSRPDLAHVVSMISRFMGDPGSAHWEALKWTLRYLNGSLKA